MFTFCIRADQQNQKSKGQFPPAFVHLELCTLWGPGSKCAHLCRFSLIYRCPARGTLLCNSLARTLDGLCLLLINPCPPMYCNVGNGHLWNEPRMGIVLNWAVRKAHSWVLATSSFRHSRHGHWESCQFCNKSQSVSLTWPRHCIN